MNKLTCKTRQKKGPKCKEPYYITIKVKLFHPESNRKSYQKWNFCKKHFKEFMISKGKNWYCWYNNKETLSPVISYEVLT